MQYHFSNVFGGGKDSTYGVILCCKVIFKIKGHMQGNLGQKVAVKNDYLYFSFIVLISVDTYYNISTIGNYRRKFDTNTCTFIFR